LKNEKNVRRINSPAARYREHQGGVDAALLKAVWFRSPTERTIKKSPKRRGATDRHHAGYVGCYIDWCVYKVHNGHKFPQDRLASTLRGQFKFVNLELRMKEKKRRRREEKKRDDVLLGCFTAFPRDWY